MEMGLLCKKFYILPLEVDVNWVRWNSLQLPAVNTSWHLANWESADILKKIPLLEAVRTEIFCYLPFHALKGGRFLKTLR